jgi:glycosyltransferase involved in cell wall biosynthesis
LKILYLSITSEIGGADLALLRTVRALDRSEFVPVVGLPGDGPLVGALREAGAEVVFLPLRRLRRTLNPLWYAAYAGGYVRCLGRLPELVRASGAAVVHSNSLPNLYGVAAVRGGGARLVWHVRELALRPEFVRSALVRLARARADRIVTVSRTVADELFPGGGGQVVTIYDSVDTAAFRPAAAAGAALRRRLGLPGDCRLAGMWCRFDEWKGLPVAIRAAGMIRRRLPGFRLVLAGGPTAGHERYADRLRRLAAVEAPDGVIFTGWLPPGEIPGFVAGLDVAVHASTSPEPFGLVIAEAMASGTPLVAPRLGSPLELVEHGSDGLLCAPGDAGALAAAVCRLLEDRELSRRCAEAGRAKAEELFETSRNVRRLESIYRQLAGEGRA